MKPKCALARGFTLIELLVVIAIISILASMLFPTYSKARESARKVQCNSNLRQIWMAIDLYKSDHDSFYPIAFTPWAISAIPNANVRPWTLKGKMFDYVAKAEGVWWCNSWEGRAGRGATDSSYDFIVSDPNGIDNEMIGNPLRRPVPIALGEAAMTQPTNYPLLFCGMGYPGLPLGARPRLPLVAHQGCIDTKFWQGQENCGTNIAFGDGHVKWTNFNAQQWGLPGSGQGIYFTMH